jgi:hypothetical protein
MLRAFFLLAVAIMAAGPARADDSATCRDGKAEAALRLAACEKLIAAGVTGKDLGQALLVRGNACRPSAIPTRRLRHSERRSMPIRTMSAL